MDGEEAGGCEDGDGVKDGPRSAEEKPRFSPALPGPGPVAPGAVAPGAVPPAPAAREDVSPKPPAPPSGRSGESVLAARANQLFVAAIACRTACRPVSSIPFPGEAEPGPSSASPVSASTGAVSAGGLALETLGLKISSAGNGTGAYPAALVSSLTLEDAVSTACLDEDVPE